MMFVRVLLISVVVLTAACNGADHAAIRNVTGVTKPDSVLVVTSNYPLYYFAKRIAEGIDAAPEIVFPVIDGDPASWIPNAQQIQLLQSADIVFLNGAGAEPWLDLITLNRRRLLDTSATIKDRLIPLDDSVLHQHGPEGEHSHQGTAFTTWLDPLLAIEQARTITESLVEFAPMGETQFRDNLAKLEQDLLKLDADLLRVFARLDGQPVLFSHPVYQYLERRYGINGESVHWEPDEAPSTAAWIELQQVLATHRATIMIWEDKPLDETAARLANAGVDSIPFHTGANRLNDDDYLSVMYENIKRLDLSIERSR
jgi:zinc transport system substrate-binding protein